MSLAHPNLRLLRTLFELHRDNEPVDLLSVAEDAGLSVYIALSCLDQLERRGLVDARRLSLTLRGLAVAVAVGDDQYRAQVSLDGALESDTGPRDQRYREYDRAQSSGPRAAAGAAGTSLGRGPKRQQVA